MNVSIQADRHTGERDESRCWYLALLQDNRELSSVSGLKNRFFLLVQMCRHLFQPVLQVGQQLHWWPCCQQTLTYIKRRE